MVKITKAILLALLFCVPAIGQTNPTYIGAVGWCHLGGQAAVTQGLATGGTQPLSGIPFEKASGVDASYPKCTITVFPTGQTSPAAIFATSGGTILSNPFTANIDGSFQFFVLPGCYDITESSGITTGSFMPTNHTDSDICFGAGGGGATTAACPSNIFGAIAYATGAGVLVCDNSLLTDGAGNATGQSFTAIAPWNGDSTVTAAGTFSPHALPLHTWAWTAPGVITTSIRNVVPGVACTPGQTFGVNNQTTDPSGTLNVNWQCANFSSGVSITASSPIVVTPSPLTGTGVISCPTCSTGNSQVIQVNGTPITTESPANFVNSGTTFDGVTVTHTNTSAGNIQLGYSDANTQASNPSTPTATVNGTPGSTDYKYAVVGCEDGPTCAKHSSETAAVDVPTGAATITSTNSITLSAYADTLYGYRCYNIYRTSSSGTPSSTGLIGNCVWKKFIDTGLVGDSTTGPITNTTVLTPNIGDPVNACNVIPSAPKGVDGPPCSPKATNDEGTSTFGEPADINDPFWTWLNQNSATSGNTGGMITLTSASRASSDSLNCLIQPAPATPYTFTALLYSNLSGISSTAVRSQPGIAFYESGTGKAVVLGPSSISTTNYSVWINEWTNTSTIGSTVLNNAYLPYGPEYFRIQNDGTNLNFSTSPDDVVWIQQYTQTKTTFFTVGPNNVGICIDNNVGASSLDVDWWRQTQ